MNGTFIVELTNPLAPKTVSFVGVEQGTHNHSIHPSGNYLYNSNSDLMTSVQPAIEIYDISDFAAPYKVRELALPTRPGLGTESHDITFNTAGDRAYSAALSQGVIINTHEPGTADDRLELPRPGDQRLAPDGPVHDDRLAGQPARVPDRRGRGRRRGRHRPVPQRRRAHLRGHGLDGVQPAEGRLLEHRRRPPDGQRHRQLHRARLRHPRGRAGDDDRLLQRRRPRGRHLRPDGRLARRLDHGRRSRHARDRLLPDRRTATAPARPTRGRRRRRRSTGTATSTSTATTSRAASTSTASPPRAALPRAWASG